jgi:hypothetical protein
MAARRRGRFSKTCPATDFPKFIALKRSELMYNCSRYANNCLKSVNKEWSRCFRRLSQPMAAYGSRFRTCGLYQVVSALSWVLYRVLAAGRVLARSVLPTTFCCNRQSNKLCRAGLSQTVCLKRVYLASVERSALGKCVALFLCLRRL